MGSAVKLPGIDAVREAAARIAPHVHRTPVHRCAHLNALAGCELFFKCEMFQRTGSFKFRGASNAALKVGADAGRRGLVTHSSGNHGQALAAAGRLVGAPVYVVMPSTASAFKRRAIEGYGATVVPCEWTAKSRLGVLAEVAERTGGVVIPPYDHPDIIAGQGTAALELLDEVRDVDAVIAPVGGGGLISGVSVAADGLNASLRVIGAEPRQADDAFRSKQSGKCETASDGPTVADGLRAGLGELTWPMVRDHVERVICVGEEEILAAMRLLWERAKLMVEPSSAVALAAVLSEEFQGLSNRPQRIGVFLSGGNVDLDHLPW
jgi:threonine dehydratase